MFKQLVLELRAISRQITFAADSFVRPIDLNAAYLNKNVH